MEQIYEPFNVTVSECEHWTNRHRKNTFFELVYILEGEGDQYVNYVRYPYKTNNFFFLPSSKCHTYNIHKKTKFAFIRFTQNYFNNKDSGSIDYSIWFNRLNYIIGHYNRTPGELIPDEEDKKNAQLLFQVILNLYQNRDAHSRMITQSSVVALLGIVAKNIEASVNQSSDDSRINEILNFIQFNLFDEQKISIKYLASKFNISETYFSEYFKRNLNQTFQDFILRSKLKIAEARVLYTQQTFKEIAYELNFTDSSHLNKMMKKFFNKGLKEIRNHVKK